MTVAMQWHSKHASTVVEGLFSTWSVSRSYLEDSWCYNSVESSAAEYSLGSNDVSAGR